MNDYYDVSLKEYRLDLIDKTIEENKSNKWTFLKGNIADKLFMFD